MAKKANAARAKERSRSSAPVEKVSASEAEAAKE